MHLLLETLDLQFYFYFSLFLPFHYSTVSNLYYYQLFGNKEKAPRIIALKAL